MAGTEERRYRDRFGPLARRSREVLGLAALVGTLTGLAVVAFEHVVDAGLDQLTDAPLWLAAGLPGIGLVVAHLVVRWGGTDTGTSDDYIRTYHHGSDVLPARPFPAKVAAAVATLGSGGAMGLEGPSIFMGATIGSVATRHLRRFLTGNHAKVLMVAGAAAGVAAIFKAPATGAVFAIEVPYRDDFGRRLLLPALVGGTTGYLALAIVDGTEGLFPVDGSPGFTLRDLGGALVLGLAAGVVARLFAGTLLVTKDLVARFGPWTRLSVCAPALFGLTFLADAATGRPLTLGPGYDAIEWARDPRLGVELVGLVLILRCAATTATLGGGGVGGLFIPLVVTGSLLGRAIGGAFAALDTELFTVVGIAAVLGAGYRVPLAAVMFVAETTGQPGFVVPGILAAVTAELLMGRVSVTRYQRDAASAA